MVYVAPTRPAGDLRTASLPDIEAFPPTEPIQLPLPGDIATDVRLEQAGADSYAVCRDDSTLGFIEVIGRIHVVYRGARADRAVEIAQVGDLETAVLRLADR